MAGLCSDLGLKPFGRLLTLCLVYSDTLRKLCWKIYNKPARNTPSNTPSNTPPSPLPTPPRYYTASAELWCFRNTRSIFRGDDVFLLVFLTLSLLAVLWLLDVESGPLFETPFPLAIVEYLLSLEVLWRLVSSALETSNFLFRFLM